MNPKTLPFKWAISRNNASDKLIDISLISNKVPFWNQLVIDGVIHQSYTLYVSQISSTS